MRIFLTIVAALALLVGLILTIHAISTSGRPRYFIYMANRTQHDLDDVSVLYGDRAAADAGRLVLGGHATYGFVTLSVPDEAVVTWSVDGVRHAPKVKLKGIIARSPKDDNVWFIFEEDGSVTVKTVRDNDLAANVRLLKTLPDPKDK